MLTNWNLVHRSIRMSLRASAHKNHGMIATGNHSYYRFAARSTTGVAIRIPLRTLMTKLPKKENGLPQVTFGHLRNDTLFPVRHNSLNIPFAEKSRPACFGKPLSRQYPSRPSSWQACRSRRRYHSGAPERRGCTGRTFRPLPSSSSRTPDRRTTWS